MVQHSGLFNHTTHQKAEVQVSQNDLVRYLKGTDTSQNGYILHSAPYPTENRF